MTLSHKYHQFTKIRSAAKQFASNLLRNYVISCKGINFTCPVSHVAVYYNMTRRYKITLEGNESTSNFTDTSFFLVLYEIMTFTC